ncbi:UPF0758 domain-containing protein [Mucilaginibacter lutimaris]|uniref:UPF0758 domain-containing protein n=1 Tax=Mucilaginibacter lutimaris TaxID=931629 RepID=A0ABW2Z8U3_9SPHI
METAHKTRYPNVDSESFGHGRMHYFIDVKKAVNDSHFVLITSSEKYDSDKYYRQTVQLWEEDLAFFVEALSMVLSRMTSDEGARFFDRPEMKVVLDPVGVLALPEKDRPREKLLALGADNLSNAELLAVLLCTGSHDLSVLDLCEKVMKSVKDEPSRLLTRTAKDFCKFRGIGAAKAGILLAALELGRRACQPV